METGPTAPLCYLRLACLVLASRRLTVWTLHGDGRKGLHHRPFVFLTGVPHFLNLGSEGWRP